MLFMDKFINKSVSYYLISLVLIIIIYGKTIFFDYVWDDYTLLVSNAELINSDLSWSMVARPVMPDTSYFRPLVLFSWWLEGRALGNLYPSLSHGINIISFYLLCAVIFNFIKKILIICTNSKYANLSAIIATSLYIMHPANIEMVAWVAGRFDLFADLFIFLGLLLFISKINSHIKLSLIVASYILALMSKETGVLLVALIPLIDLVQKQDGYKSWTKLISNSFYENKDLYIGLLIITGLYIWIRASHASGIYHQSINLEYINAAYFEKQLPLLALSKYINYSLFPFINDGIFSSINYITSNKNNYIFAWLWLTLLLMSLIYLIKIKSRFSLILISYLLGISLVIHLLPLRIAENLIQHRFLGLSLGFISLALAFLADKLLVKGYLTKESKLNLLPFIYLVSLLIFTSTQTSHWKNSVILWSNYNEQYKEQNNGLTSINYFKNLLHNKSNLDEIKSIVDDELAISKKLNIEPRVDIQIGYAEFLIRIMKDPKGLAVLDNSISIFENGNFGKKERNKYLENLYRLKVQGSNYINNDHKLAKIYLDKIETINESFYNNPEYLQELILVNVLDNNVNELKQNLARLAKFNKVQYSDKSVNELLYKYVNFFAKASCKAHYRIIPACENNFDMSNYVKQLDIH